MSDSCQPTLEHLEAARRALAEFVERADIRLDRARPEDGYRATGDLVNASAQRKRQFGAGRRLAEDGLRALGLAETVGREGRLPVWPRGAVGSISHTGDVAAAVVTRTREFLGVGVDVERIARVRGPLARRILSPDEKATSVTARAGLSRAGLARVFSAKEAGYKAINPTTHHYIGFSEASIEFGTSRPAPVDGLGGLEFTIRYHGDNDASRRLHAGRGVSLLVGELVVSLFVIPAGELG